MSTRQEHPHSWFKINPQIRHSLPAIDEMTKSLKEHGQLQDVAALADGTLIYGHRRLAAGPAAGIKKWWVQVYDEPLTPTQITVLRAVENIQRVDLTKQEIALICKQLVEGGLSQKQAALQLGKDEVFVSRYMTPWKCICAVQEAFLSGAITIADCCVMAQASEREQHELLAAKLGGASADDLRRRIKRRRKVENEVRKNRVDCPLPSGMNVTVTGEALSLEDAARALLEAVKHMKSGAAEGLDAKTFKSAMLCKRRGKENEVVPA